MNDVSTEFIFKEFEDRGILPRDGMAILIQAHAKGLVFCSEQEDLQRNLANHIEALKVAVKGYADVYYELTKEDSPYENTTREEN